MNIQGQLVDILTVIDPKLYGNSLVLNMEIKFIYPGQKAINGIFISKNLFYKKFR